jgi:uncharacterized protein with PQ loop repeat
MAFLVASAIWLVGIVVASITAASGFYADVPIKIAVVTTIVAILIALTHGQIPSW